MVAFTELHPFIHELDIVGKKKKKKKKKKNFTCKSQRYPVDPALIDFHVTGNSTRYCHKGQTSELFTETNFTAI